jgi:hypothetical protein
VGQAGREAHGEESLGSGTPKIDACVEAVNRWSPGCSLEVRNSP